MTNMTERTPVFETEDLERYFTKDRSLKSRLLQKDPQYVKAVDDVSLTLERNEIKGFIGESGCGKSTLLETLLGLQSPTGGEILFEGTPTSEFTKHDWKEFRRQVQVVFQNPFDSLDPKLTVGETLRLSLNVHDMDNKKERVHDTLEMVELEPAQRYIDSYPDQLSGGEKQRVAIARALILEPEVLIADEPVSMLDVSTQAEILNLLLELIDEKNLSVLYVSHDISTVGYLCDNINVMYLGRVIESGTTEQIINSPKHPYTKAMINAVPIPNPSKNRERTSLEGSVPNPVGLGEGCRFRDRCPERMDICDVRPRDVTTEDGQEVACHLHYDHEAEAPSEPANTAGGDD